MFKFISTLLSLLTKGQRWKLYYLQIFVMMSAVLEVSTVLSIGPFMALVGNTGLVDTNYVLNSIYLLGGFGNHYDFLIAVGVFVLVLMLISSFLSILTIRKLSFFAATVGSEFGNRLYKFYLNKGYLYHASTNSSELVKKISVETLRVTDNILQPIMQINARIITIVFVSIFVFIYNPIVSLFGVSVLILAYSLIFKFVKNRLLVNGQNISEYSKKRFTLMNEGFSSIKEIKVLGRSKYFIEQFDESGVVFAKAYGSSNTLYNAPKYVMELVVYGAMIGLVLLLLNNYQGDLSLVLPVLGVFGVAALKLLPSFQQVYSGLAQIKSNVSALNSIEVDLKKALLEVEPEERIYSKCRLLGDVELKSAYFSYLGSASNTLNGLDLVIPYRGTVGIVGASGSGKSTLFDVLIGAVSLDQGELFVGNDLVTIENNRTWQNNIGYVGQVSSMRDGTISENIAFGLSLSEINEVDLANAINMAQLSDWVRSLPDGLNTRIGEQGVQISGGQKQRLAIARALYSQPEYLFFDEATSALDVITERAVMQSIQSIAGEKTIVMVAHRLNTVRDCDIIYVVERGVVVDSGSYSDLVKRNVAFSHSVKS